MAKAKELQFDVTKLKDTRDKCKELADDLAKTRDDLKQELATLKEQWHTKAGIEFFKIQDVDWAAQVDSYIKITGAVVELLECAISKYSEVETAAKSLKLKI